MPLLVMRHAAAVGSAGTTDRDRPLSPQGEADAAAVGRHLASRGLVPRRVVSSDAARAAETARLVAGAAVPATPVELSPGLYEGGVEDILAVAAEAGAAPLLIVGHEPTLSHTVQALCGATVSMVPAAVVCIDLDPPARPLTGRLRWMLTPDVVASREE